MVRSPLSALRTGPSDLRSALYLCLFLSTKQLFQAESLDEDVGNMCIKFADDSKLEELTDLESEMISTAENAGSKASR